MSDRFWVLSHSLSMQQPNSLMRALLILLLGLSLGACSLVYKLPTRQGNVIEQKQLDKLELGMTKDQVKYLLGTPIAASPFRDDRWDYLGYYKSPRGKAASRVVSIYFEQGKVSQMDGIKAAGAENSIEAPDVQTVINQEKKEKTEDDRVEGNADLHGGIFAPDPTKPETPDPAQMPNP